MIALGIFVLAATFWIFSAGLGFLMFGDVRTAAIGATAQLVAFAALGGLIALGALLIKAGMVS